MIFEFSFPDVGEGVHEGKVLEFTCKSGDELRAGDIIAVVETDKVVAEIPSSRDGVLDRYGVEVGDVIQVGQTLAYIRIPGEEEEENAGVVGELETRSDGILAVGDEADQNDPASGSGTKTSAAAASSMRTKAGLKVQASPVARKLAADLGLDIASIAGSGPMGRVMKEDVLSHSRQGGEQRMSESGQSGSGRQSTGRGEGGRQAAVRDSAHGKDSYESIPLDPIRSTIAANMEESQAIPAALIQDICIIDELWSMRTALNRKRDEALSFQPFFMKALALAIRDFPRINSHFLRERQEIRQFRDIHIGLAVDTERGLMVPVIRDVEDKSIEVLNREMRQRVEEAVSGRIDLGHLRGGTFTLTNYGSFGGIYGRPMILPPQAGIMGFGRVHEAPAAVDGELKVARVLPLSFAFDHRVVDGAYAARFVTRVMEYLSTPRDMWIKL